MSVANSGFCLCFAIGTACGRWEQAVDSRGDAVTRGRSLSQVVIPDFFQQKEMASSENSQTNYPRKR